MAALILVEPDCTPEVICSTLDFKTRNLELFEMVETLLQGGKDRVENHGRGSARPTQVNERLVAAK